MRDKIVPALKKIYYSPVLIWVILAYGILTRFGQYLSNRSIWFDESLLVMNILERGYLELLSPLDNVQAAPPVFLLLTKLLTELFGHSEYILRLIPFISGIAALFLFAKLAGRLLGRKALPPALALLVLSDRAIYYSAEAKQYSVELLMTIIILLAALYFYKQSYGLKETVILGLTGCLVIWCAYPSVFVLAGTGITLFLFALKEKKEDRGKVMARLGLIAVLWSASFAVNYLFVAGPASRNEAFYIFFKDNFLPFPPATLSDLGWYPQTVINLFCNPLGFSIPHAALLVVIITAGVVALWKTNSRFSLGLILMPLAVLAVVSAMRYYPITDRLVLFTVPLLYLIIGEGIYHVTAALSRRSVVTSLVLVVVLFSMFILRSGYHLIKPRLNEEAKPVIEYYFEKKQAGDQIYVYHESYKVFEYYTYNQGVSYIPGANYVNNPQSYQNELDGLAGKGRIWFFFSHDLTGEESLFRRHLDQIGEMLDSFYSHNAMIFLYDLGGEAFSTSMKQRLVPDEYVSIQEAIESAGNGDRIIVKPGTYKESIDFMGKEIAVQSSDPADPDIVSATIIQGTGEGSVVSFCRGEGSDALLSGFTITGGRGTVVEEFWGCFGGGILVMNGSNPVISNNLIRENSTDAGKLEVPGFGGGVAVLEASPLIMGNTISGNNALIEGGGIYILKAAPNINSNYILSNFAKLGGGMAISVEGSPLIFKNIICDNRATEGGGINIAAASPVVTDNFIEGNIAEVYGGGISAWRSSLQASGNLFRDNFAGIKGGGMILARDAAISPWARFRNRFKNNSPDQVYYQPADYS